jgi:hypothetical protein
MRRICSECAPFPSIKKMSFQSFNTMRAWQADRCNRFMKSWLETTIIIYSKDFKISLRSFYSQADIILNRWYDENLCRSTNSGFLPDFPASKFLIECVMYILMQQTDMYVHCTVCTLLWFQKKQKNLFHLWVESFLWRDFPGDWAMTRHVEKPVLARRMKS